MAGHGNVLQVDLRARLHVIHYDPRRPRPDGDLARRVRVAAVDIEHGAGLCGKVIVIRGNIGVAEGEHGEAEVAKLLRGEVGIRHGGREIDEHRSGYGLRAFRADEVEREREAFAVLPHIGLDPAQHGLSGAERVVGKHLAELDGVRLCGREAVFVRAEQTQGLPAAHRVKVRQVFGQFHGLQLLFFPGKIPLL